MDVSDIVKKYLKDNGYDGLCTEDCGCKLGDLFPCDNPGCIDCVPGKIVRQCECSYGTCDHFEEDCNGWCIREPNTKKGGSNEA